MPNKLSSGMLRHVVWQKFTAARGLLIALMMEVVSTSETSVNFYHTARRNIPEDSHLHTGRREDLKSQL
jgi:cell division protein FtsL